MQSSTRPAVSAVLYILRMSRKFTLTLHDNLVLQVRVLRPESFWFRETGKVVSVDQVSITQFSNVSAFDIGQIRSLSSVLTHRAWAHVLLHTQLFTACTVSCQIQHSEFVWFVGLSDGLTCCCQTFDDNHTAFQSFTLCCHV